MPAVNNTTAAVTPRNASASNMTTGATLLSVLKVVNSTASTPKTQATTAKLREAVSTKNNSYANGVTPSVSITQSRARYNQTTSSRNESARGNAGKTTSRQQQRRTTEQQTRKNSTQTESSDAKSSLNSTVTFATKTTSKRSHSKPFIPKPAGSNSRNATDFTKTSNSTATVSPQQNTTTLYACQEQTNISADEKFSYSVKNNNNGTNTVVAAINEGTLVAHGYIKEGCAIEGQVDEFFLIGPSAYSSPETMLTKNIMGCCEPLSAGKKTAPAAEELQNNLYELPSLTYMVEKSCNGTNIVLSTIKDGSTEAKVAVKEGCSLDIDGPQSLLLHAGSEISRTDIRLTKDTSECETPMLEISNLVAGMKVLPSKVIAGKEFYHQVDKQLGYYLIINGNGTNTVQLGITGDKPMVSGYIKKGCSLDTSEVKPFQLTALEPRQGNFFLTKSTIPCFEPIVVDPTETKRPVLNPLSYEVNGTIDFGACLMDHYTKKIDGTTVHRLHNKCDKTKGVAFTQGCRGDAEFPNQIRVAPNETVIFLSQDSYRCRNRAFEMPLFSSLYCKTTRRFKRETEKSELPASTTPFPDVMTEPAPTEPRAEAIVNGRRIDQETRKYLGMLENSRVGWLTSSTCSGAMITNRHFLTAGHCLEPLPINTYEPKAGLSDLTIKFNAESRSIPCIAHKVKAAHIIPCFFNSKEKVEAECDVALVELEKPISNCEPIKLISDEKYCEFAHAVDDVLRTKLNYPYISQSDYNKSMPLWTVGNALVQGHGRTNNFFIDGFDPHVPRETRVVVVNILAQSQTIETSPPLSGGTTCFGDSGSPLIYIDKAGEKWQVGTVSSGEPGCVGHSYFANVKNPNIASWLKERLNEDASVALQPEYLEDLSRVKIRPSTCVTKKNLPETGWWGIFTDNRQITIANHCNISGYSNNVKVKLSSLQTGEVIDMHDNEGTHSSGIFTVKKGETRVVFTKGYVQADIKWTK